MSRGYTKKDRVTGPDLRTLAALMNAEWRRYALCAKLVREQPDEYCPELWFPVATDDPSPKALRVCADCPVKIQCADYAFEAREPNGIWGGMGEKQRRAVARKTRLATPLTPEQLAAHIPDWAVCPVCKRNFDRTLTENGTRNRKSSREHCSKTCAQRTRRQGKQSA